MDFNSIQILVLILVAISSIKILFMIFKKQSFESFANSYIDSIKNNPWLYFSIYLSLSILCLYLIITKSTISYTEIAACTLFMAFLINAGMIGTSILDKINFSKINWKMGSIYISIWLFVMYKALEEIFILNK